MNKKLALFLSAVVLTAASHAQQQAPQTVTPNENLVAEGVPSIPTDVATRANRYTESRGAAILDWHPTKREVLISTRFADVPQIHRVAFPGGARTQLTFFPDRIAGASYHPHTGDYFLFTKDVGGGEWFQIFRFDNATGDIAMLTDGKSRNLGITWSNKGDRIAYSSTRRNRADLDFYVMSPTDKSTDKVLVQNQGGGWGVADWSPDDTRLLAVNEESVEQSTIYIVDVASGQKSELTPKTETKVVYAPIGFSADGKGIYLLTDKDNEFQRVAYMDLATKQLKYLTSYKWDADNARLSWNRRLLAFTLNENGLSTLHVLDLASGKERTLPKIPTGVIFGLQWHENNRELAFALNSYRSPSDVFSIDLGNGKVDRWTYSELGGLNPDTLVEPKLITWKSFDGRDISGWLYQPDAKKFPGKRPVIVSIHGGPEGQAQPIFLGRSNYYLNELGVAIVMPNVRGSTGYGKTFVSLDNGFKREDSYKDLGALFQWIKQQPTLDGNKILAAGGSYGGHMTFVAATRFNDLIACSNPVVGISNLVTFLQNTEAYRRDLRRVEYGDERDPKMKEFLESIAPMNHIDQIKKPIFIVAGANDPRVPKSEADQIVASLQKQNTPAWYLWAKDEGHGFAKKKNADFQFYSTIQFVQSCLLGNNATQTQPATTK